jgi:hypothetical protein
MVADALNSGRRACAPSFGNNLHWASQFLQAINIALHTVW